MATVVQSLGGTAAPTGNALTVVHRTTAAAPVGSRVVVCAGDFDPAGILSSCADNSGLGLVWVKDEQDSTTTSGHSARGGYFSADAPLGLPSGTDITVTFSVSAAARWICAQSLTEIQGGASGYLSGTPPAATVAFGGTTFTLPSITTVDASAVVLGMVSLDSVTADVVSWTSTGAVELQTIFDATTTEGVSIGYRIVSSIGSYALGGTFSAAPGEQGYNSVAYKAGVPLGSVAMRKPDTRRFPKPILRNFASVR